MPFALFSSTSRNSTKGLRPRIIYTSMDDIITAAYDELRREGRVFEELAGIGWSEDEDGVVRPVRTLTEEEILALSIQKLGDDGRVFEAFDDSDTALFVEAAEKYDLTEEAKALVERIQP